MKNVKLHLIWIYFRIKPEIKKSIGEENLPEILNKFKDEYKEIDVRIKQEKGIMSFHRLFLILGLSLYNSLKDRFQNKEELIDKIHDILWKGRMSKNVCFIAFFVRQSKNPFKSYLKLLGPNNEWFFPCPPWEKVSVEIENGIGWHQKKCPYKDFFENEGNLELCRAYCDMDHRVAELVPNSIILKRQHTLAKGDDYCDFLYYNKY